MNLVTTTTTTKKERSLEDQLYIVGWIFLTMGSVGMLLYLHIIAPMLGKTTCTVYRLLGIYCPGCGGTRAVRALLKGHILMAAWYHPLVPYTVIVFGGFMLTQTLARLHIGRFKGWHFHEWHFYAAVGIMIANFLLKNVLLLGFRVSL